MQGVCVCAFEELVSAKFFGKLVSARCDEWTAFGGRSLRAVRDLLNRSMLVWICILALLVISGVV